MPTVSTDIAESLSDLIDEMCRLSGVTVWLLEDDGETLQQSVHEISVSQRPRGIIVNSSHPFFREFYEEAERIEKRPLMLALPGSAWGIVDDDVRVKINTMTYRTDGPLIPISIEGDNEDPDSIGTVIYFLVPISRF